MFYDIELIDISDNVENQEFNKVSKEDLDKIISVFKTNKPFLEFNSENATVVLKTKYYRGIMYFYHNERPKSVIQETFENATPIKTIRKK